MAKTAPLFPVVLVIGVLALPASATQVFVVPVERMAREADVIVHARVGAQRVQWDKAGRRPLTLTEIEVLEPVKGAEAGEILTIYQVGGSLDGRTLRVPGALAFAVGEEMVFFAVRYRDPLLGTLIASYGMGLGKYEVARAGDAPLVAPAFGDVTFVERERASGALRPVEPPPATAEPLAAFLDRLRKLTAAQR